MTPAEFMAYIFEPVESGWLTVVHAEPNADPTKKPYMVSDRVQVGNWDDVNRLCEERKQFGKIWYNVGIQREELTDKYKRGSKEHVGQIAFLWMDIDLPKQGNPKMYPPLKFIQLALSQMPLRHSLAVMTGGGLHVYWLFNRPMVFDTVEKAVETENTIIKPWRLKFEQLLLKNGTWKTDSVQDVARMLRIVGTKSSRDDGSLVEIDHDNGLRYDPNDFSNFIDNQKSLYEKGGNTVKLEINIGSPTGDVDHDRLMALIQNCDAFNNLWSKKCQSQDESAVEFHLACHAIEAGWTDEQAANLILAYAKKNWPERVDEKLNRKDSAFGTYLGRTVFNARVKVIDRARMQPNSHDIRPASADPTQEQTKAWAMRAVSSQLGIDIADFIQVGTVKSQYCLVLGSGQQVDLGACDFNSYPKSINKALFDATGHCPEALEAKEWRAQWTRLYAYRQVIEVPEMDPVEEVLEALRFYIQSVVTAKGDGKVIEDAKLAGKSFIEDDSIYLNMPSVIKYVNRFYGTSFKAAEFMAQVRKLSFRRETVHCKRSTKSYWAAPVENFQEYIEKQKEAVHDDPGYR